MVRNKFKLNMVLFSQLFALPWALCAAGGVEQQDIFNAKKAFETYKQAHQQDTLCDWLFSMATDIKNTSISSAEGYDANAKGIANTYAKYIRLTLTGKAFGFSDRKATENERNKIIMSLGAAAQVSPMTDAQMQGCTINDQTRVHFNAVARYEYGALTHFQNQYNTTDTKPTFSAYRASFKRHWDVKDDVLRNVFDPEKPLVIAFFHGLGGSKDNLESLLDHMQNIIPNLKDKYKALQLILFNPQASVGTQHGSAWFPVIVDPKDFKNVRHEDIQQSIANNGSLLGTRASNVLEAADKLLRDLEAVMKDAFIPKGNVILVGQSLGTFMTSFIAHKRRFEPVPALGMYNLYGFAGFAATGQMGFFPSVVFSQVGGKDPIFSTQLQNDLLNAMQQANYGNSEIIKDSPESLGHNLCSTGNFNKSLWPLMPNFNGRFTA
jgi:predicted esterase